MLMLVPILTTASSTRNIPSVSSLNKISSLDAYTSTVVLSLKPNNSSIVNANNRQDAYISTVVLSLRPKNSSIISNNRQDAYTSTVVLHLGPKSSSTYMSTDYQPDISGHLLAGVLSVVGILCIAAVAIVVVLLIIIRTMRKKAVQIERLVHPCTGNGVHKYCHDCSNRGPYNQGERV